MMENEELQDWPECPEKVCITSGFEVDDDFEASQMLQEQLQALRYDGYYAMRRYDSLKEVAEKLFQNGQVF